MNLLIFVTTLLIAVTSHSIGHDQGGGGGGFCINGTCKTLAEAGFKFKDEQVSEPILTKDVFTELNKILKKIYLGPENNQRLDRISKGEIDTYVRVEIADEVRFERAKEEYVKILNNAGFKTDNFELFAFSDRRAGKTYLLPSFFKLGAVSKAKILIHEGIVRTIGSVTTAIKMDIAIEATLNGKSDLVGVAAVSGELIGAPHFWMKKDNIDKIRGVLLMNGFILDRISKGFPYLDIINSLSNRDEYDSRDPEQEAGLFEKDNELWKFFKRFGVKSFNWRWFPDGIPYFYGYLSEIKTTHFLEAKKSCKNFKSEYRFLIPYNDEPAVVICDNYKVVGLHEVRLEFKD